MGSIKGVSHLSRKAKRRLCCRLNLWMWRKRWKNYFFRILTTKRRSSRTASTSGPRHILHTKTTINSRRKSTVNHTSAVGPHVTCVTNLCGQKSVLKPCEPDSVSIALKDSSYLENNVTDTNVAAVANSHTQTAAIENFVQCCEIADVSLRLQTETESDECGNIRYFNAPIKVMPAQRLELESPTEEDRVPDIDKDERIISKKLLQADVHHTDMTKIIREFLDDFYRHYGSFIPLQKSDVLRHLKRKFNMNFSDRKALVISEVLKYKAVVVQTPRPVFQVLYKKHTLTLDDLLTLADQHWLNDQIMNMYGELIMDSVNQEVHFLNSFFHRQLMTKGYDGVKRWTKQVDLFSKRLILVPIHLEVHWCLVTADIVKKRICLYDSQGNSLQKVARNILKYLMTEATEKNQTDFESNWTVVYNEKIPQQTNENDCGVFVLEYCRCLALSKPLQFSQKDIPKIRKRIYKELCDCELREEG